MNNLFSPSARQELRAVTMTDEEKRLMKAGILISTMKQKAAVRSPFGWWFGHRLIVSFTAAILIIILSGGGIALAASESLPGDTLYSVKINMLEPLGSTLAVTPEKKAVRATTLASVRLNEAEHLAARGTLDQKKEEQLAVLMKEQTETFVAAVKEIKQTNSEAATDAATLFEANLSAHARVLVAVGASSTPNGTGEYTGKRTATTEDSSSTSKKNNQVRPKRHLVAALEAQVRSVEEEITPTLILATGAESSRGKLGSSSGRRGEQSVLVISSSTITTASSATVIATTTATTSVSAPVRITSPSAIKKYAAKKNDVEALISKTNTLLNQVPTSSTSSVGQRILKDAHTSLRRSEAFLEQAEEENYLGNSTTTTALLENSKRAATEAKVLLNLDPTLGLGDKNSLERTIQKQKSKN